jgi:VanZ family protein
MALEARTNQKRLTVIVVGYWLALFLGTHVPRIPTALQMPGGDKWQHTVAYAGLACLLAARRSFGKPLTWRLALGVAGVVIVYGAIDELTQIPVGRDAEFKDWLADSLGTLIGLGLFTLVRFFSARPK